MTARRLLKAAEAIREVVSMAILTELRDPRVRNVTVTFVEVAPDMRSAKVHVSVMGDETQQNLSLRGLQNSAGFLQHKLSDRIDTRYTPRLQFVLDQGVKNSIAVAEKLRELLPESAGQAPDAGALSNVRIARVEDELDQDSHDDELSDDELSDDELSEDELSEDEIADEEDEDGGAKDRLTNGESPDRK